MDNNVQQMIDQSLSNAGCFLEAATVGDLRGHSEQSILAGSRGYISPEEAHILSRVFTKPLTPTDPTA